MYIYVYMYCVYMVSSAFVKQHGITTCYWIFDVVRAWYVDQVQLRGIGCGMNFGKTCENRTDVVAVGGNIRVDIAVDEHRFHYSEYRSVSAAAAAASRIVASIAGSSPSI